MRLRLTAPTKADWSIMVQTSRGLTNLVAVVDGEASKNPYKYLGGYGLVLSSWGRGWTSIALKTCRI